jgi:hypothetical protein
MAKVATVMNQQLKFPRFLLEPGDLEIPFSSCALAGFKKGRESMYPCFVKLQHFSRDQKFGVRVAPQAVPADKSRWA